MLVFFFALCSTSPTTLSIISEPATLVCGIPDKYKIYCLTTTVMAFSSVCATSPGPTAHPIERLIGFYADNFFLIF